MANSVQFESVTKRYGAFAAISDVSFEVGDGETVALLGPSGCGKTTILRTIAGFEAPTEGTVRIAGTDMARRRPYERNIGLLFQHYALFPHMTVTQNVAYGLRHRGVPKADIPARVAEMLALVKLPGFGERFPSRLSGGQQQRVALARALATRPGVVLLDEPLSALDAKLRQELRVELKEVLAAVGSTAIVVTHDQEEAMSLGERVFIMNAGRIVQQGTPDAIYGRPESRFVAEFMGRSNWFTGRPSGDNEFETDCGLRLTIRRQAAIIAGPHQLCVRPETIDVVPGDPHAGPNRIPCRVLDMALMGAVRQVMVQLPGGRTVLTIQRNDSGATCLPGQSAHLRFAPEACLLIPADQA
jgi:ABC-type Fe3+/spermidine/putrescine transport system ATPase subunit